MHKNGAKIVNTLHEATLAQKYFLMMMAADDINYQNSIDLKLTGIGKGVGVEFSGNNRDRQSTSFREEMKQKQKERGVNLNAR